MNKTRISEIDYAKGFSILSIILFHYLTPYSHGIFSKAVMLGGAGVHIFFFISGFGLTLGSPVTNTLKFYQKRYKNIIPPYFIAVTITFALSFFIPIFQGNKLYALAGHLFLFKMFDESIIGSFGYHFWFISTIIQFYLAYPFIIRICEKANPTAFIIGSIVISSLYWIFVAANNLDSYRVWNSFFLQYLWEFCLGIALANKIKTQKNTYRPKNIPLTIAMTLGLGTMAVLALFVQPWGKTFNDIPSLIGYGSLCLLTYNLTKIYLPSANKLILKTGNISYDMYLYHILVFVIIRTGMEKLNIFQTGWAVVSVPISLLITYIIASAINQFRIKNHPEKAKS